LLFLAMNECVGLRVDGISRAVMAASLVLVQEVTIAHLSCINLF